MTDDYTREVLRDALADIERGVQRLRTLVGDADHITIAAEAAAELMKVFEQDPMRYVSIGKLMELQCQSAPATGNPTAEQSSTPNDSPTNAPD